ncbi:DUF7619 domain-containing protein [Haliscomenobacter hydrossis]|uniref:Uncharacterized protein n=1 Tax=Haliscomenobacter hydrossis (strain ATCC 27775 / DSM 1100 / LMG 10767 / O) TaxID=760192 RepID=F4KRN6_HALH1|nr:T9SS type A sorting domain-containing protein [Haliscomenobacter hydrossis]AEE49025.1 hypothetical protein Halhy_1127 [Haliscomenobacter hydrossis DSM 1100]
MKAFWIVIFCLLVNISHAQSCDGGDQNKQHGCPNCDEIPFPLPGMPWDVPIVTPFDPNDILGPVGYADSRFVRAKSSLSYMIRFENDPDFATAPAQKVVIRMPIDDRYDLYSFRLGEFGFGQFRYQVPNDQSFYRTRITNTLDSLGVYVDLTAGIDVQKSEAFWIFESIDPTTGLRPEDALTGFLPVNDTAVTRFNDTLTKRGEGFTTFTLLPRQGIASGDTCKAQAAIIFDINPPIPTNVWTNTVDALPPQSKLKALPKASPANTVLLEWTAADDPQGSGLAHYDLYVSKNEGPFYLYKEDIDTTFYLFAGENLAKYAFYIRASDHVGNTEAPKTLPEAITTLGVVGSLALASPRLGSSYCAGDTLHIQWQASNAGERFALYYSPDEGKTFSLIQPEVSTGNTFAWFTPRDLTESNNALIQIRSLDDDRFVANSGRFSLFSAPGVELGADRQLLQGDSLVLSGKETAGLKYQWSTGASSSSIVVTSPGTYTLAVIDQNGCRSTDSVKISRSVSTIDPNFIQSFSLFPNPAEQWLNVQFNLRQSAHLNWFVQDTKGKLVQQGAMGKLSSGTFTQGLEINLLPAGNYVLVIKANNRRIASAQFFKVRK